MNRCSVCGKKYFFVDLKFDKRNNNKCICKDCEIEQKLEKSGLN